MSSIMMNKEVYDFFITNDFLHSVALQLHNAFYRCSLEDILRMGNSEIKRRLDAKTEINSHNKKMALQALQHKRNPMAEQRARNRKTESNNPEESPSHNPDPVESRSHPSHYNPDPSPSVSEIRRDSRNPGKSERRRDLRNPGNSWDTSSTVNNYFV